MLKKIHHFLGQFDSTPFFITAVYISVFTAFIDRSHLFYDSGSLTPWIYYIVFTLAIYSFLLLTTTTKEKYLVYMVFAGGFILFNIAVIWSFFIFKDPSTSAADIGFFERAYYKNNHSISAPIFSFLSPVILFWLGFVSLFFFSIPVVMESMFHWNKTVHSHKQRLAASLVGGFLAGLFQTVLWFSVYFAGLLFPPLYFLLLFHYIKRYKELPQ